jgi:hypothetical protein
MDALPDDPQTIQDRAHADFAQFAEFEGLSDDATHRALSW